MRDKPLKQNKQAAANTISRRKFLRNTGLLAGGAIASTALAACAPAGAPEASQPTPTTATQPTPTTVAQPTPTVIVQQEPIVLLEATEPVTLDPQFGESGVSANVFGNIFEALTDFNRALEFKPRLAESYEVLDDKVTWRFKLREGVQFWNGEPFNAEAVKFTVERTLDEELRSQGLNDPFPERTGIQKVVIQDNYTVDLVLEQPTIVFPVFVHFLYMLEPNYYSSRSIEETAVAPMGTGPWMFKEWVKGDHLTIEANPNYWGGEPSIKTLIYKPVPEASQRLNLLLTGDADIALRLNPDDAPLLKDNPDVRLSIAKGGRRDHIGIPTNIPRYSDRRVRHALRYAINWDALNDGLLGGMAEHRGTVLAAGKDWIPPTVKPWPYDPDKARSLLEEAEFPMDEKITIYAYDGGIKTKEVLLAVAGQFRDVGLNADVQMLDWSLYVEKMHSEEGPDDLYFSTLGTRFFGPEDLNIVLPDQIWDATNWVVNTENGPKFEALNQELVETFDGDAQREIVFQMLELFEEESPWLVLWPQPVVSGASNRTNWEDYGGGGLLKMWPVGDPPVEYTG